MAKLEIKPFTTDEGETIDAIYVNGEAFDWGFPKNILESMDDELTKIRYGVSIKNHFVSSFSEFVGRKMNLEEILKAIEKKEI